jgi:spore coat polysaccharide biosynthesis protein SpsF
VDPLVVAVIQARTGSTRLPGKVLRRLGDASVLDHVIRRMRAAPGVDRVVVATTTDVRDDPIVQCAESAGVAVTRGSEGDVLSRFAQAFREHGGQIGVRVTSDCPCLDPILIGDIIQRFRCAEPAVDYVSNTLERSYPRGYDVEVFGVDALLAADALASDPSSREHVTPFLYRHPERFRVAVFGRPDPLGTAAWRVTLDTEEDWRVIEYIFATLAPRNPCFGLADVEALLLAHPEVLKWNRAVVQKGH